MRDPEQDRDDKPGQIEPTDNCTGAPVDLDRVHEVEQTERDGPSGQGQRTGSSPAGGRRRKAVASTNGSKSKREFDIARLREWAGANDVTVPARGRIPQAVVDQYKQAGGR
jgi:hypothetical protein